MWSGLTIGVAIFIALFGVMEVATNGFYLATGTSVSRGRKQHGDLPAAASDAEVHGKVLRMGIGGALALTCCLVAWATGQAGLIVAAAAVVFLVLAYDAVRHRYYRSYVALVVATVLLVLALYGTR